MIINYIFIKTLQIGHGICFFDGVFIFIKKYIIQRTYIGFGELMCYFFDNALFEGKIC